MTASVMAANGAAVATATPSRLADTLPRVLSLYFATNEWHE